MTLDGVPPAATRRAGAHDLALVLAALCFGGTFLVVQDAVEDVEPIPFLAVRFLARRARAVAAGPAPPGAARRAAATASWPASPSSPATSSRRSACSTPDSATSAFITYLLVVFVPLLGFVAPRRRPHPVDAARRRGGRRRPRAAHRPGRRGSRGFGKGEAAHARLRGRLRRPRRRSSARPPTATTRSAWPPIQVARRRRWPAPCPGVWLGGYRFTAPALAAAVATAVVATALAFVLQVAGQRTVPPARAALLLLLEPVFAGAPGRVHRRRPCAAPARRAPPLILVAVVLSETVPGRGLTGGSTRGRLVSITIVLSIRPGGPGCG